MNDQKIYSTSDFNLSCFLAAKGLEMLRLEDGTNGTKRVKFVFSIPEYIDIVKVLKEWESKESDAIRLILFKSKLLRTELKKYFDSLK